MIRLNILYLIHFLVCKLILQRVYFAIILALYDLILVIYGKLVYLFQSYDNMSSYFPNPIIESVVMNFLFCLYILILLYFQVDQKIFICWVKRDKSESLVWNQTNIKLYLFSYHKFKVCYIEINNNILPFNYLLLFYSRYFCWT